MAYRNAQEIFPEGLLRQIQRYVSGETIYVPAREEKRAWGETSGYQEAGSMLPVSTILWCQDSASPSRCGVCMP